MNRETKAKIIILVLLILIGVCIDLRVNQFNNIDRPLCMNNMTSPLECYALGVANGSIAGIGNMLILGSLILVGYYLLKND